MRDGKFNPNHSSFLNKATGNEQRRMSKGDLRGGALSFTHIFFTYMQECTTPIKAKHDFYTV